MLGRSISYPNTKVWGMLRDRINCNKRKRNPLPVGGVIGKEGDGVKFHYKNHGTTEKLTERCLPRKHVQKEDFA